MKQVNRTVDMDRRQLLKATVGAAAIGTGWCPNLASAAATPRRIDMHAHLIPDFYRKAMNDYQVKGDGGVGIPAWSTNSAVNFMDKFGFQAQVVSLSEPGFGFLPDRTARVNMAKQVSVWRASMLISEIASPPNSSTWNRQLAGPSTRTTW